MSSSTSERQTRSRSAKSKQAASLARPIRAQSLAKSIQAQSNSARSNPTPSASAISSKRSQSQAPSFAKRQRCHEVLDVFIQMKSDLEIVQGGDVAAVNYQESMKRLKESVDSNIEIASGMTTVVSLFDEMIG